MCSPVGHSLGALAIGIAVRREKISCQYLLFCVFSGNAPDLDLIIGWILGDINGYHHLGSHSLFAAFTYGLLVFAVLNFRGADSQDPRRLAVAGGLMYGGHVLLDMVSRDQSDPVGMQLLWPFSDTFFAANFVIFPAFHHDTVGGDMVGLMVGLFSWHNVLTVARELAILVPLVAVAYWLYRRRQPPDPGSGQGSIIANK